MATKHSYHIDAINSRLHNEIAHFIDARIAAIKLGHHLGGFQQIENTIYGATCHCGDMAFIDILSGELSGLATTEPCVFRRVS